jgi:hypothetical protein
MMFPIFLFLMVLSPLFIPVGVTVVGEYDNSHPACCSTSPPVPPRRRPATGHRVTQLSHSSVTPCVTLDACQNPWREAVGASDPGIFGAYRGWVGHVGHQGISRDLTEQPGLEVLQRLPQFGPSIHHEGPIGRDWFANGQATQDKQLQGRPRTGSHPTDAGWG